MKFWHVFREAVLKFHFSTPDSVFVTWIIHKFLENRLILLINKTIQKNR
jgi:hypothetical protein